MKARLKIQMLLVLIVTVGLVSAQEGDPAKRSEPGVKTSKVSGPKKSGPQKSTKATNKKAVAKKWNTKKGGGVTSPATLAIEEPHPVNSYPVEVIAPEPGEGGIQPGATLVDTLKPPIERPASESTATPLEGSKTDTSRSTARGNTEGETSGGSLTATPTQPQLEMAATAAAYGSLAMRNKNYPEAESHFRQAVNLDPGSARHQYMAGLALFQQKKFDEAESHFRLATRIDPSDIASSIYLGRIYLEQKKYADAEFQFRTAVKARPEIPGYNYYLAEALQHQEKDVEAEFYFREATRLHSAVVTKAKPTATPPPTP